MAIDLYDPSDIPRETPSEYKYALTCIYAFTRLVDIVPLKTKTPQEVALALIKVWSNHGFPAYIRHDQGNEFFGKVKDLCTALGVKQVKSAPRSAHSNGAIERVHKDLGTELRRLTMEYPNTAWHDMIPFCIIKSRATVNRSTGFSAYELTGIIQPSTSDNIAAEQSAFDFTDHHADSSEKIHEHREAALTQLFDRRTKALANDIQTRDQRLVDQNKSQKPLTFHVGQWIRINNKTSAKMAIQTTSPMKITKVSDDKTRYTVIDPDTSRTHEVNIKNIISSNPPDPDAPKPSPKVGAHAIIASMTTPTGLKYYVLEDGPQHTEDSPRHQYGNTRQNTPAYNARWIKNIAKPLVTKYKILKRFTFAISSQNNQVIPLAIRKQFKDFEEIC